MTIAYGHLPIDEVERIGDQLESIVSDTSIDGSIRSAALDHWSHVVRAAVTGQMGGVDAAIRFLADFRMGLFA